MIPETILTKATKETAILDDVKAYQQVIRSIMYAMTSTQPDLVFTILWLSKFNAKLMNDH